MLSLRIFELAPRLRQLPERLLNLALAIGELPERFFDLPLVCRQLAQRLLNLPLSLGDLAQRFLDLTLPVRHLAERLLDLSDRLLQLSLARALRPASRALLLARGRRRNGCGLRCGTLRIRHDLLQLAQRERDHPLLFGQLLLGVWALSAC
jgi:hypothetical protein